MFLSVIMPIYNVEKYIEECLNSIVKQNAENMEVICVDDGSTDNSGAICDKYAEQYNYFKVIHTENKGVGAARNLGLSCAQGDYVAWIDPDDYIADNWFESIVSTLEEYNTDILVFNYYVLKNGVTESRIYAEISGYLDITRFIYDVTEDRIIQSQLWHKVFRRCLFDDLLFPTNTKCMEDYAILHFLIEKATKIYYLNQILYTYRVREDGLVLEVDIHKSYDCYLIAKERYTYLAKLYPSISKLGYLVQALGVCIHYFKSDKARRLLYIKQYSRCKNEIKSNISIILADCNIEQVLKIKFICACSGLLGVAISLNKLRKSLA